MAFFDEVGKKITQTSQGVVQKTKDTAEIIKLNSLISDEEKRITNFYNELGKIYFDLHGDSYEPAFEQLVLSVKEAKEKIDNYSEQVKRLKGTVRCPNCGGDVPYEAPFCSSCGTKMNVQNASAANNNAKRCVKCGASLTADMAFCTNCGTKVEAPTPVVEESVAAKPTVKVCPNCGKEISVDAKFCIGCGSRVED